jgi:hypothetical protein
MKIRKDRIHSMGDGTDLPWCPFCYEKHRHVKRRMKENIHKRWYNFFTLPEMYLICG